MTSAIKQSTAAVPTTRNISDALYAEVAVKTTTYSVLTTDHLKTIILDGASADVTFTLPTVGAGDDGLTLWFFNDDPEYVLTVKPADSDTYMYNSGMGYGIDMPDKGTIVKVIYCHSRTQWIVRKEAGGKVMVEGLKLHERMNTTKGLYDDLTSPIRTLPDLTGSHVGLVYGNVLSRYEYINGKFPPSYFQYDGVDAYIKYYDSSDWDIFGDQTGHKTVAFWVYFDVAGTGVNLVTQYETGLNLWHIRRNSSNVLEIQFISDVATNAGLSTEAVSIETWYHVAIVINGNDLGLYLDGVQTDFDDEWTTDLFTGKLYIGQKGTSGNYLDGRMQDLFIAYNNPLNADINADGTSGRLTKPEAPMQLVM